MDNRIANDMISSGMIPSGEKNKEDLSRTQYGSVPSPNKLMDAYKSIYEHHQKDKDGNTIPHEGEELNEGKIPAGLQAYLDKKKGKKEDKKDMKEQYDLVYEHFIGEGFSEEETFERMSNLTEEQLDEFMKALAARAAQYGANLGKPDSQKINVINPPRKPFDTKRKPFDAKKPDPKPGDSGFKAKSASDVVNAAAAIRRKRMEKEMKPKKGEVMADEYQHQIDEIAFLAPALGKVAAIATKGAAMAGKVGKKLATKAVTAGAKTNNSSFASDMARGAATQLGANMVSGGSGGQKKQKTGTVSTTQYASADLFDIVKGQLLDEGLSEEEIKDIMLTLTPDEILNEISAETALAASKARDVQAGKLKGPENTEKRAELRAKASQNYDRAVEKRKSGFVKNTASPQGPSRIPTGEA